MKHSIYFLIVGLFWGCMIEEGELPDMHPSKTQKSHGLALFFEQKLRNDIQTRSQKMDTVYKHHTLLIENVRLGYSKQYGGYYFIVPLRRNQTGEIDAGLVYPLQDGEDLTLSSEFAPTQLLDQSALNATPDSCRFLLSNKFLTWKKKGLSVSRSLYAYAESLDGKSIFTPSSQPSVGNTSSLRPNLTRSAQDYPYEATIYINYNMTPYVYGDGIGVTASLPSIEARRNVFVSTFEHLEFVEGVGDCELTSIGAEYVHLEMTVDGIGVVEEAVQLLMIVSTSRFQSEYGIEEVSYYYDYTLTLDSDIISVGSGVGGGNVGEDTGGGTSGGGNNSTPGGENGIKPNVELMDISKFVAYNGDCLTTCIAFLQNYNCPPGSPEYVYQLRIERNGEEVYYDSDYQNTYQKAIACIDRHLDAGRPILVGTSYQSSHPGNHDATTDHFVVITGRGYDANRGMYYYTYMDSAYGSSQVACNLEINRLYYDEVNYTFHQENYRTDNVLQHVTHIRPNDGNTQGTVSQLNINNP